MNTNSTKSSPTALNKRGTKVFADEMRFDSIKERDFYMQYVRNCVRYGYTYKVHPRYMIMPLTPLEGVDKAKIAAIKYTPDFVVYDTKGIIAHVYDVKNSLGAYGIDQGNKLRFRLFAAQYGIPVEAVVLRAHHFKSIAQGLTKSRKTNDPIIRTDFQYPWTDATALGI